MNNDNPKPRKFLRIALLEKLNNALFGGPKMKAFMEKPWVKSLVETGPAFAQNWGPLMKAQVKPFAFLGYATRGEWIKMIFFWLIEVLVVCIIPIILLFCKVPWLFWLSVALLVPAYLWLLLVYFATTARRFRDIGLSGWFLLPLFVIGAIPCLSKVVGIIMLCLALLPSNMIGSTEAN